MRILLSSMQFVEYGLELATELSKEHELFLLFSKYRVRKTFGSDFKTAPHLPFALGPDDPPRLRTTLLFLLKYMRIIRRFKPDIIHLHEPPYPAFIAQYLLRPRPLLVTIHDVVIHPGDENPRYRTWRMPVHHRLRKRVYPKVHLHGNRLRDHFCEVYERSPEDTCVIPHGSLFSFQSKEEPTSEEPATILLFGRIQKYKGLNFLLEAEPMVSERIPDFKVIVAGSGPDLANHREAIEANPHFELHDRFIPNEDVAQLFHRASAVVLPYIEASQSGVLSMAFAFGKPVIATDVGSLSEMVVHGESGLVIPAGDVPALGNALIELLSNQEKKKAMAVKAKETALTRLSWKAIAQQTADAYRAAIDAFDGRRFRPRNK